MRVLKMFCCGGVEVVRMEMVTLAWPLGGSKPGEIWGAKKENPGKKTWGSVLVCVRGRRQLPNPLGGRLRGGGEDGQTLPVV